MVIRHSWLTFLLVTFLGCTTGQEYDCYCNFYVQREVYDEPSTTSTILGRMYEFDCKPGLSDTQAPGGWVAIAFEHQIGYVEQGQHFSKQICPGHPSTSDILTTHVQPSSTTTMQATTTVPTTPAPTTPVVATTPTTTETTTSTTTTPTTTTTTSTQRITTTSPTTTIRIFPSTTTRRPTVVTSPTTTATALPTPGVVSGDIRLCPAILHQYTREDGGALTQYGDSCYELVPIRGIWAKAENDCRAKGGHLFHIESQAVQEFIYHWIKSYNFDHAVWTGLHDLRNEEYFEWISGDHLLYTNWYPDRYGNLASHHIENCVLLVPYAPYYGEWDDVQCGITTQFGDSGQQNPFICQYPIHPHHVQTGGILVGK